MATYTTDLTDITNTDGSAAGTFVELTGYTQGGSAVADTDFFIMGTGCTSAPPNRKTGLHSLADNTGAAVTIASGECVFVWHVLWASNGMAVYASDGLGVAVGNDISNFEVWQYGGSNVAPNPYGGWKNIAVDVNNKTPDHTTGTPTTYQTFGVVANILVSIAKGNLHAMDIIRYGRGEVLVQGTSATFALLAAANDAITTAQWGLFQGILGGYLWKGLMTLGTSGTAITMDDSNVNISVDEAPLTYASFNRVEINNAASSITWTSVNFSAILDSGLGADSGLSVGEFEMVDNATVDLEACVFTDMSTFIFQSNADLTGCTFRRCGLVTQGGATFTGCTFDDSSNTPAFIVSSMTLVSGCTFVSAGTGHAIELTTAGTYNLTDSVFTGYGLDDTTNAAIYNNSGGLITLNKSGGLTPTVRNGTGASTVIQASVLIDVHVQDEAGADVGTAYVYIDTDPSIGDTADITNTTTDASGDITQASYSGAASSATIRVRKYGYKANKGTISLLSDTINTVILIADPQQT